MWLVKSPLVSIQARYLQDEALAQKNLYVKAVAIGGRFIRNSTLIVGSLDGVVSWNGKAILEPSVSGPGSSRNFVASVLRFQVKGILNATQSSHGQVVAQMPHSVTLTIKRKRRHVDVFIKMPPLEGGQEGLCGNFNGLAGDDSLELVEGRADPRVAPQASLFQAPTP